jgi:hypothetical protein
MLQGGVTGRGTVQLTGIRSGSTPNPVVVRGAPGSMASRNQDFAYASCVLNQKRFELHVNVEYQETSEVVHEVDVSMCDENHATVVRTTRSTQ